MNHDSPYFKQAQLLVQVVPFLAEHPCFALKGGTAINLFVRDLPRLSVDIDLTFVPVDERDASLRQIHEALQALKIQLETREGWRVTGSYLHESKTLNRLLVESGGRRTKVEVSTVLRGCVHPPALQRVRSKVEQELGFAETLVLDFSDLYAGKLCAALDRQHPRDLYDVKLLLENEGISETLKNTFLVYLLSHQRPLAELLAPNPQPLEVTFEAEFSGMTLEPVSPEELVATREALVIRLNGMLTESDKAFLLSVKQGEPDWPAFHYPEAQYLPAVRWKLHNLGRMDADARRRAVDKLAAVLNR